MSARGVAAGVLAALALLGASGGGPPGAGDSHSVVAIRNGTFERKEFQWDPPGVQAALDFVKGAGGIVLLGPGELPISHSLDVWDETTLEGRGRETKIHLLGPPTSRERALVVGSRCRIANLTIIGTGYLTHDRTSYGSHGIIARTTAQTGMVGTVIEGCYLSDWNTIAINLVRNSDRNIIRNNVISRSGWEGIYVSVFCDSNEVANNLITDCRRNAIDVVGSGNRIVENVVRDVAKDSLAFASDTFGILIYSRQDFTGMVADNQVVGNIVQACYGGITILAGKDSDNWNAVVKDNDVFQNRRYGIWVGSDVGLRPLARVRSALVAGNRVHQNDSDGICLERLPRGTKVVGNQVFENGGSGVRVWSAPGAVDSTLVGRNAIHNNRRYGVEIDSRVVGTSVEDNLVVGNALGQIADHGQGTTLLRNRVDRDDRSEQPRMR